MSMERSGLLDVMGSVARSNTARDAGRGDALRIFRGVLSMLFIAVLLICMAFGVMVYSKVANEGTATSDERLSLNLLLNDVRADDAIESVEVGDGPQGPAMVLIEREASGTYETRVYPYDGMIMQEYALSGSAYSPGTATPVVRSDIFEFSYEDGLLTIVTEHGSSSVALRSYSGKEVM